MAASSRYLCSSPLTPRNCWTWPSDLQSGRTIRQVRRRREEPSRRRWRRGAEQLEYLRVPCVCASWSAMKMTSSSSSSWPSCSSAGAPGSLLTFRSSSWPSPPFSWKPQSYIRTEMRQRQLIHDSSSNLWMTFYESIKRLFELANKKMVKMWKDNFFLYSRTSWENHKMLIYINNKGSSGTIGRVKLRKLSFNSGKLQFNNFLIDSNGFSSTLKFPSISNSNRCCSLRLHKIQFN